MEERTPGLFIVEDIQRFGSVPRPAIRMARIGVRLLGLALQVKCKEVVHAMPGIEENMGSREIVELARIHHEGKEIAFTLLECFVDEPDGLEVRDVLVGRAVKHEQGPLQSIDMRNR
jgi:hypothetical protein